MIILFNPRSTKPRNRRLPLSVLALGAVLEGREEYEIVDGNLDDNPTATILRLIAGARRRNAGRHRDARAANGRRGRKLPGNSRAASEVADRLGRLFSVDLQRRGAERAYVDYVVRGQGEDTLLELLEAMRGTAQVRDAFRACRTRMSSACIGTIPSA